jgi:DNA-binding phage protein
MRKRAVKKTVSLQPDVWEYVASQAKGNASAFINEALRDYRRRQLHKSMIQGYKAMASQAQIAEDLALWDTTLLDGLSDEDNPSK